MRKFLARACRTRSRFPRGYYPAAPSGSYMNKSGIKFSDLEGFLSLYPDKIYRNMYKVGVLNGIST